MHGYGVIKNNITWNIVETKLPILVRELPHFSASDARDRRSALNAAGTKTAKS
jgi:uncharacterized protein with HEPN domain